MLFLLPLTLTKVKRWSWKISSPTCVFVSPDILKSSLYFVVIAKYWLTFIYSLQGSESIPEALCGMLLSSNSFIDNSKLCSIHSTRTCDANQRGSKIIVTVNNNSPIQDYVHPDDQTQPFEMTPGFKPFTIIDFFMIAPNRPFVLSGIFTSWLN